MRAVTFVGLAFMSAFDWLKGAYATTASVVAALVLILGATVPPLAHLAPWRVTVPAAVVLLAVAVMAGAYRMWDRTERRAVAAENAPPQLVAGAGGSGYNAGGGGGVAGPGGYAEGGKGGSSPFSLFDFFGRRSYETGRSVRELAGEAGLTAAQMGYAYGQGGDGGGSGPDGGEGGQAGNNGIVIITAYSEPPSATQSDSP